MAEPHKVMIIDGNVLDVLAAERSLRTAGFTVCHLTAAAGAAARLEYEEPDVLFVDPSMPRLALSDLLRVLEEPPFVDTTLVMLFMKGDKATLESKVEEFQAHGYYGKTEPIAEVGPFLRKTLDEKAVA